MERFSPFYLLIGAVFLSWLLVQLRGGKVKYFKSDTGCFIALLLILLGLLVGWIVKSATDSNTVLLTVIVAIVLAMTVEVSRMF